MLVFGLLHFKFDVLESILLYGGIWTSIYWTEFNTFIYLVHLRNCLRQGVSFFTFCYLGVTGDSWTMRIIRTSYTVAYLTTFILVLMFAVVMKPFLGGWSILLSNIETYDKSNLQFDQFNFSLDFVFFERKSLIVYQNVLLSTLFFSLRLAKYFLVKVGKLFFFSFINRDTHQFLCCV